MGFLRQAVKETGSGLDIRHSPQAINQDISNKSVQIDRFEKL